MPICLKVPNRGVQNQLARAMRLLDSFGMTPKMKHLMSVNSGGALSSVEEHFLHTEGVAGSSPAARTILNKLAADSTHPPPLHSCG